MMKGHTLFEKSYSVIAILFYTGAIAPFFPSDDPRYFLTQIFQIPAFLVALFLIYARLRRVLSVALRAVLFWVLMAIVIASPLWSDWPSETWEKILPLIRVTTFGVYFGTCYTLRQQLRILTWAFGIAAVLSLLTCVLIPSRGVMGVGYISSMEDVVHTGKWRGIFIHKTELGSWMILTSIVSLFSALGTSQKSWIPWSIFALSVLLLVPARATGALVILIIILGLIVLYRALRFQFSVLIPFSITLLIIFGGAVVLLIANLEPIVVGLGKDITISGRTDFWPLLIDKILERPFFGYGYEAFWEGGWKGEPSDIWKYLKDGFRPPHAHNGPLELLLSIGFIGFTVFVSTYLVTLFNAVYWVRRIPTIEGLLPLTYLTFIVFLNLTESYLMRSDTYWLLFTCFTLTMSNQSVNVAEAESFLNEQSERNRILSSESLDVFNS